MKHVIMRQRAVSSWASAFALSAALMLAAPALSQEKNATPGKKPPATPQKKNMPEQKTAPAIPQKPAYFKNDSIYVGDLNAAIVNAEELIKKYPDSDFSPSVMFQLIELYVKRATFDYQKQMAAYERDLKRFDNGEIAAEPAMPRVSYRKAIEMGYKVLEQYPTAPFNDKIIYRLALCHLEEGNQEMARDYFQRMIKDYPNSPYVLEANFRIGEACFEKKDYVTATQYYSKLFNQWQNPFFSMALYKLAWSYYNVNDYAKAISTFIYLIDDINNIKDANNPEALGKTPADLRQESIEYIAQSFAEYGGPEKAREFLAKYSGKDYGIEIFLKLAETYRARNFYDEAIRTVEITLEMWPFNDQGPLLQNEVVENYLSSEQPEKAEVARLALVNNFGPGSAWLEKHPEGEIRQKALALAEQHLYILGTEAQARAQANKDYKAYQLAIQRYQEYVAKFPDMPNAPKISYYLAECFYETRDFANAADAYKRVMMDYPESEFKDDAAYNRIISHFDELATVNHPDTTLFLLANFMGTGRTDTLTVSNAVSAKLLTACNDFAVLMSASPRYPEVLMKYGETLFNLKEFRPAQLVYEKIITTMPKSRFGVQAHLLHAQCSMEAQDFLLAEKWARKVAEQYPDSTVQIERAQRLISSAKFKLADGFKAKGEHSVAAIAFENIAASSQDSTISELALAESATAFEKAGNKLKAVEIYEKFNYRFPNSPRVDEALYRAALLCEEDSKWTRAAQNYLALVTARPNSPYAGKAIYAAARCYENAGLQENALKTYDRYLATNPAESEQVMEALCRAGDICFKRQDFRLAASYFGQVAEKFLQAQRSGQSVEPYFPAQAQFMLGEIQFDTYRRVNLEPPLDKSLQRKQALFKDVQTAFTTAAKYQVGEWATAAVHRIGSAFEEFARAFWESPRPSLEGDLKVQYEQKLDERIRPFKEKAYETYEANLRQARENEISNDWVDQSRTRLQTLAAELGRELPPEEQVAPATNGTLNSTPVGDGGAQAQPSAAESAVKPNDIRTVSRASTKGNEK